MNSHLHLHDPFKCHPPRRVQNTLSFLICSHQAGWCSDNALDLYSAGARFEFRWDIHYLACDCDFPPGKFQSSISVLPPERFLPNHLQFIIHHSFYHSTPYSMSYWRRRKINHEGSRSSNLSPNWWKNWNRFQQMCSFYHLGERHFKPMWFIL
jgi:hypothetical protein